MIIRNAIRHTSRDGLSEEDWVSSIVTAVSAADIHWAPGVHNGRVTSRHVLQLVGAARTKQLITAPRGSLKREAMEAEMRMEQEDENLKKARRQVIDFGSEVPFKTVPEFISSGFAKHYKNFASNKAITNHFQVAQNCLVRSVAEGDPRSDLMLMLALTMAASSATPEVNKETLQFAAFPKRKEPELLAAVMITRMLWFLRPDAFPEKKDDRGVLCVAEMVKKIGSYATGRHHTARRTNPARKQSSTLSTTGF